ncbi:hypothetical protein HYH02_011961 [Chlamydomonas schloesseri]|uniref:FAD-binding FR-type domain-containing protein n=1 Tax=Chlamydomonas schloesseri TaxID=2026947 RepID=A0A835W4F0_9CHLO|nr:hypothetical protein HYH02_011961 [Chlamydomonas schloesseri]|eukprot:KAG2435461.1 hypothetical protein HYH02_011961 [Chlamydomonas schloesseri]
MLGQKLRGCVGRGARGQQQGNSLPSVCPGARKRRSSIRRAPRAGSRSTVVTVRAGPVEIDEEDLIQGKDRYKWYEAKFCAEDQPAWNIASFVSNVQVSPVYRAVTLSVEVSRERIPLAAAYKAAGQRAVLRVNNGLERQVAAATPPFPEEINTEPLFKVRGDLFAHEIKAVREPISVKAPLTVLVTRKEAPELWALGPDDVVEVGPFAGTGLDLRGSPLMAIYACPTVVIFVEGRGIATCRALLEASADVANLNLRFRRDVRVYYKVPNSASVAFKEEFAEWEALGPVRVVTTTSSFQDAFDDDDSLTYDPDTTGAIILVGGDEEAEKAAREVCKDADISRILADSAEQPPMVHLAPNPFEHLITGKPRKPMRRKSREQREAEAAEAAAEAAREAQAAADAAAAAKAAAGEEDSDEDEHGNGKGNGNGKSDYRSPAKSPSAAAAKR